MPDPGIQSISSQMEMMQQMQSAQSGMLVGAITALQQTIRDLAEAGRVGAITARQSGSAALASIQYGAATAIGDLRSVGQAIQAITPGPGPAPPVGGAMIPAGGGRTVAGPGIVHGASVGALTGLGLAGEIVAFEAIATAGGGMATLGAMARGGFAVGRGLMGGGAILGTAGGLAGGALGAAGAIAVPLAAAYAVGKVAELGIEHISAAGSINNLLRQNMWRNVPFDPNVDPSRMNFRPLAQEITRDITQMRGGGFGGGEAAQIVGMGMELGLFQGAGGADEIRGRARDLAAAVRDMTRDLGTSLQESMMMMAEVKQAGFDPTAAGGVLIQARGMGRAGGFTGAEMHMAGMRGAQAFRGLGVSPAFGYNAAQSNLATASQLTMTGAVPPWLVASMGGRQGMADQMTQGVANFINSPIGNVFAAAMNAPGGQGNLQGGFDELGAAALQGAGGTAGQYVEFLARRRGLLEQAGPEAAQAFRARMISRAFETEVLQNDPSFREMWDKMDKAQRGERIGEYAAARFVGSMGIGSADEARVLGQLTQNPQTFDSQSQAMRAEMHRTSMDRYYEEHGPMGWMRRTITRPLGRGLEQIGADIARPFVALAAEAEEITTDVSDWMYGVEQRTISESDIRALSRTEARGARGRGRAQVTAPRQIRRLEDEAGYLIKNVERAEYEKSAEEYVTIGPPGTEGSVRAILKADLAGVESGRRAARNLVSGEVKYSVAEKQALDNAYDNLWTAEGLDKNTVGVIGNVLDKNKTMESRIAALTSLTYGMLPNAHGTESELEKYDAIPGDTEEAKRSHLMNIAAKDIGALDVMTAAAKGLSIQSVTAQPAWKKTARADLAKNLESMTEKAFGTSWNDNAQRLAIKTNINDIYRVLSEDVSGTERAKVFRRIARAAGGGVAEAAAIQERLTTAFEADAGFRRQLRAGAIGREVEAQEIAEEKFGLRVGEAAEQARIALARAGGVTEEQQALITQVRGAGSAVDLREIIQDYKKDGDRRETLEQVARVSPLLGRAKELLEGDGPATQEQIKKVLEHVDIQGTTVEAKDPAERARVNQMKQVDSMFKTTHVALARLAQATAILHSRIQKAQPHPTADTSVSHAHAAPEAVFGG